MRERVTCTSVTIRFGGRLTSGADFKVEYGPSGIGSVFAGWEPVAGKVRGPVYTVVGLTPNTSYVFRVRGTNEHGESEWSDSSEVVTTLEESDVPAPPAPPVPTFVAATAHTMTVKYGHPADADKHKVHPSTTYVLQAAPASMFSAWQAVNDGVPMVAGQYVLRGLPHSTPFTFRVKATNDGGESEFSEATVPTETTFTTAVVPVPDAPAAPVFRNTASSGVIEVVVGQSAPRAAAASGGAAGGASGGAGADGAVVPSDAEPITYVVEYSANSMMSMWTKVGDGSAKPAGTVAISGLENGTEYVFRCFARSEGGDSAWSESSEPIKCGGGPVAAAGEKKEAEEKGGES